MWPKFKARYDIKWTTLLNTTVQPSSVCDTLRLIPCTLPHACSCYTPPSSLLTLSHHSAPYPLASTTTITSHHSAPYTIASTNTTTITPRPITLRLTSHFATFSTHLFSPPRAPNLFSPRHHTHLPLPPSITICYKIITFRYWNLFIHNVSL